MCAGAIYNAGISRVVYGLSQDALYDFASADSEKPAVRHSCRLVFDYGGRQMDVSGPNLEAEAAQPHADFWNRL